MLYFRDLLRNPLDADPDTNFEQAVDGSVTPVYFELQAPTGLGVGYDIFVTRIRLTFVSGNIAHNNWGDAGNLTNGVSLYHVKESDYEPSGNGIIYFAENAVTTAGFWWQINIDHTIELNSGSHVNGPNSDLTYFDIDCENIVPGGIKLARNKQDFIRLIVQDDLTSLVSQRCYIHGYKKP